MKKLFALFALGMLTSCAMLGPKPHVVYSRPDIKTVTNKLIIFPTTDFNGIVSEGANDVNIGIISAWGNMYGSDKVIPAGPVVEKLTSYVGKETYLKIVKALDNTSMVEQLHKDPKIREFISTITSKLGNYNIAVAIISGGSKEYDAKVPVSLHIGMFDTENLTWKWITKIEGTKGIFGNWKAISGVMVSNSFDEAKKLETVEKK